MGLEAPGGDLGVGVGAGGVEPRPGFDATVEAMPRCPHCTADFDDGVGNLCPHCGQDVLLPPASSAPRPFDADEAGFGAASPPPLPAQRAPARTVSTAGPATPVAPPRSDVAATGWGAQPDARQYLAAGGAPPELPVRPPPLPAKPRSPSSAGGELPPHLAVARDWAPPAALCQGSGSLDVADAISSKDLEIPQVPKAERRVSDRWVKLGLGLVVAGGLVAAYEATRSEPAPEVRVDPALRAEAERRRRAVAAMERGHELAIERAHAEAADAYRVALALEPDLASAQRGLAIALSAVGQKEEAVRHYRRYLELEPDAADAAKVKKIVRDWERARTGR